MSNNIQNRIDRIDELFSEYQAILLTGAAGTGKTYTINNYVKNSKFSKIAVTALTGLASLHLKGTTIHRFAGTGVLTKKDDYKIIKNSYKWKHIQMSIKKSQVIIVDEISMMRADMFELLDMVFREATKRDIPFGGKKVMFCGDFLQLPPVVRQEEQVPYQWVFQHPLWKEMNVQVVELKKSQRQQDEIFIEALHKVRYGHCPRWVDELFKSRVDIELDSSLKPIRFLATNKKADSENIKELRKVEGRERVFYADVFAETEKEEEAILRDCIAQEKLSIKKGAQVMLLKNDIKEMRYINGSMGIIEEIKVDFAGNPLVKIRLNSNGDLIAIGKERWERKNEDNEVVAELYQIPIKLAYAITIHKSQGMTLDCVEIDCSGIFTEGQMYVALSRVRNIDGLVLKNWNRRYIYANKAAIDFYSRLHSRR